MAAEARTVLLVEERRNRTIPEMRRTSLQTRVVRAATGVIAVSVVASLLLLVERRFVEHRESTSLSSPADTSENRYGDEALQEGSATSHVDGAGAAERPAWWDQAVLLDSMNEIWPLLNNVQPRADGCYISSKRTAEDKPAQPDTATTPPSTTPALDAPVGTIERGKACGRGSMRWRYRTGDVVSSSAAFHDGAAVIGSRDGVLYALGVQDGELRWKSEGHGDIDVIPHIDRGVVYFGTGQGQLLAADVKTGETLWRVQNDSSGIFQSSPTTHDELLVTGGGGNRVRAFQRTTGEKVWEYNTELWVQSSVAIRNGIAYVGSDDGWLHAMDVRNGKSRWRFAAALPGTPEQQPGTSVNLKITPNGHRSNVLSTPRFYKNMVFITSVGGVVFGVNADTGEEVWRHVGERSVTDTTVSDDGIVYVHTDAAILRAYDAMTGRVLWGAKTGTNKNIWSGPYQTGSAAVVHGDEVIIGGRDGDITAYDRHTGEYRWNFRTGRWIQSSPRVEGDVLIVGSDDGWIYALNLS